MCPFGIHIDGETRSGWVDHHLKDFFSQSSEDETPRGNFHKVIALHESPDVDWETLSQQVPALPKGWFELAKLNTPVRIEFTREFWLSKLPYHPKLDDFLVRFFSDLDDIGIFLTQQKFEDPFSANLVYSLKGDRGFYKGNVPSSEEDLAQMQSLFPDYLFPQDYLDFFADSRRILQGHRLHGGDRLIYDQDQL